MNREEFSEFKRLADQNLQASATQLLQGKRNAWENERKKDAKIQDLERHIKILQAALERSQDLSDQQWNRGSLREPQTYTPKEAHASASGAQSLYDTLPGKLRQVAVELVLLRADVAKSRRDWVIMEQHGTYAAKVADLLNDVPISARCEFYRGIAFFGQRRWAPAHQAFEDAEPCVGVYVSVEEAEEWRQKLKAMSDLTPQTNHAPSIKKATPVDQSLSQGFESLQRISSWVGTPDSVRPRSSFVPVIRQPLPPSVPRNGPRAGQRITYVPGVLDSITDSIEFELSLRHAYQTPQGSTNRAISGSSLPPVGRSAAEHSSDGISPLNTSRPPRFAANSTIAESETNGESPLPAPPREPTGRFSIESDSSLLSTLSRGSGGSTRSNHSSIRDRPRRPSRLSVHFKPDPKPSEPCVGSNPSQKLVQAAKRFTLASSSSSSSNRLIPSSQPREGLIQPARRFVLSSNSSPSSPIQPHDGGLTRVAVAYPPPPRRTPSSGTSYAGSSYAGSSNMSPQVMPPDLDDNRQEFPVLAIISSSPQINSSFSQGGPLGHPERSITPLTEEALSRLRRRTAMAFSSNSMQRSDYGPLGLAPEGTAARGLRSLSREHLNMRLPGLAPRGLPLLGLGLVPTESGSEAALDASGGAGSAKKATDPSRPSWPDWRLVGDLQGANQPDRDQRGTTDEGEKPISQPPPSDRPAATLAAFCDLTHPPGETKEVKNEAPISALHVQEETLSNVGHDGSIIPSAEVADTEDGDGDEKKNIKEAGDMDRDITNKGNNSSKETQPENPFKYGIKKSRKDPDFDSLYDVSTSGAGSHSGPIAGDGGAGAGDDIGKETQHENPFRQAIKKSRKDPDFDSLYDLSTSGAGSWSGPNAGDEGVGARDQSTSAGK